MRFSAISAVFPLVIAGACTHEVERSQPEIVDGDTAQAVFVEPSEVLAARVYLGDANLVEVTEEMPWHYGVFDLEKNGRVGIELSAFDDSFVGFKIYKVNANGTLTYLGQVEGEGWAGAILRSSAGGSFVVESVTEWLPSSLQLDITCLRANGKCSPKGQPNDACGSRSGALCENGLFCALPMGCGRADEGGTCSRPAEYCTAAIGQVVCGCDGRDYTTGCTAHSVGVNIDYVGHCPCDPATFAMKSSPNGDERPDVVGGWTNKVRKDGYNFEITSSLALDVDGTYVYEQVHTPLCIVDAESVGYVCRMASLYFSSTGTWEHQGFAVQLIPDSAGSPDELAQSFGIYTNCVGDVRLQTTEVDQERVLERDRCHGVVCGDGEHCELQQVQCVTTPCDPVPACVQ